MFGNIMVKSALTAIVVLFVFASSALAFGPHHRKGFFHRNPEKRAEMMVEHISEELELDTVQQETLNEIKNQLMEKRKALKMDREQIINVFKAEMANESFDSSKLQVIIDSQTAKFKLETEFFTAKLIEFHQMLSQTQRELVVQKMEEMKQRREDRKNGWFYKTPEERADMVLNTFSERLDFSEDQFAEFSKIKLDLLKARSLHFGEDHMMKVAEKFSNQFAGDTLDATMIQKEMNDAISRMEKMMKDVLTNIVKAHQILNSEQRAQILEFMEKHGHRHRFSKK